MNLALVLSGATAALRGFSLALGNATVRRTYVQLVLALMAATIVLYGLGGWLVWHFTQGQPTPVWLVLLRVAGWLMVLLVAPVVALFLVHIAFPMFSERVFLAGLRALESPLADELAVGEGLTMWQSAVISLRRLGRFLLLTAGVLMVSLIPFVGSVVAPVLQLVLAARMLGGELLDPFLSMKGLLWPEQRAYLTRHRPAVIGFGLPWALVFAIPLVGPLIFGLAQAASAVLVHEVLEAEA